MRWNFITDSWYENFSKEQKVIAWGDTLRSEGISVCQIQDHVRKGQPTLQEMSK